MGLFTESELRRVGRVRARTVFKDAATVLGEARNDSVGTSFDVFLSHSLLDSEIILGVKSILEGNGLAVYVDWLEDSDLDRSNVTVRTAERLRIRMKQSRSLVYAHSNNSPDSKWMPWELGYFDGLRGAVSVLPVAKGDNERFKGQEFLGLYPYIDHVNLNVLFVNRGESPSSTIGKTTDNYVKLNDWLRVKAGIA